MVPARVGLVEDLKGDGHPLESGCPIRKWEEVGGHEDRLVCKL